MTAAPWLGTALLATSLAAAVLHSSQMRAAPSYARAASKTAATALLAAFAALRGPSWLLASALALGAVGDAFLAWPGDEAFLRGLGSFLVAHVCYTTLFFRLGGGLDAVLAEAWRKALAAILTALALVMCLVLVPRVGPSLRAPVIAYSTTILAMLLAVLTLPHAPPVTGALLFAVSDALLAADEFLVSANSQHRVWMQHLVWTLYYSSQLLIALGVA